MKILPLSPSHRPHFLVVSRLASGSPESIRPLVQNHLDFLGGLSRLGKVVVGGPLQEVDGHSTGDGAYVLAVDTSEEAQEIVTQDPFHAAGIRSPEILIWQQKIDL